MSQVAVIGLGYIGLPTALFFAKAGFKTLGIDIKEDVVSKLIDGILIFEEPGMVELFESTKENISFSTKVSKADVYIITVPTPFLENKTIDEKYIDSAFESISMFIKKGDAVVLESTVPPMITEKLAKKIQDLNFIVGEDVYLGHVPETIIPGNMVEEFVTNKRLIGGYTHTCAKHIAEFYRPLVKGEVILTDLRTAEFVKVIENTYRDINIAFANELMHLSDEMNIDVHKAIEIANKHPRVNIHTPGGGVGGHCISVDPWFLVGLFEEKTNIIKMARDINDRQPHYIYEKLNKVHDFSNKKIGVYGLAYKPNIDDFRESPSFTFIEELKKNNIDYISFDHHAVEKVEENQLMSYEEFSKESDLIIIYVEHECLEKENSKFIRLK